MNVTLNPSLAQFIEDQIRAGRWATPDDVINAALAHLQAIARIPADEVDELRAEAALGVEQADRGEFVEFTAQDIIAEGRKLLSQKQKAG